MKADRGAGQQDVCEEEEEIRVLGNGGNVRDQFPAWVAYEVVGYRMCICIYIHTVVMYTSHVNIFPGG